MGSTSQAQPVMGVGMGYQPHPIGHHPQQMAYYGYQQMAMPYLPQPTASVQFGFGGGFTVGIQPPSLLPAMPVQPIQPVLYGAQMPQMPVPQPNQMLPLPKEDDLDTSDDSMNDSRDTSENETAESEDEDGQYVFFLCVLLSFN